MYLINRGVEIMSINNIFKQTAFYTGSIVLSLGPSQIFGVIKGVIDSVRLVKVQAKIHNLGKLQSQLDKNKVIDKRKVENISKKLGKIMEEKGNLNKSDIMGIIENNKKKSAKLKNSLLVDAVAMVPLAGTSLSCRVHRGYWGLKASKGVELGSDKEVALENKYKTKMKEDIENLFYPGAGLEYNNLNGKKKQWDATYKSWSADQKLEFKEFNGIESLFPYMNDVKIKVDFTGESERNLSAWHYIYDKNAPTVVIFHGNAMIGPETLDQAYIYAKAGYNVLMPTMGGYPGSEGVKTSEASSYEDVEAIKKYLFENGVEAAGYHGVSIGGTLAFQAAAGDSNYSIKSLFVTADRTFASGKKVAERILGNKFLLLKPFGKAGGKVGVPKGLQVNLGNNLVITTDGLDNIAKAKKLKDKDVTIIAIEAEDDQLMGKGKGEKKKNFSRDILAARYPGLSEDKRNEKLIVIEGNHNAKEYGIRQRRNLIAQAKAILEEYNKERK